MELILYGVVMLVAMTLAGVIGFAANVLALPVLSMFFAAEDCCCGIDVDCSGADCDSGNSGTPRCELA